MTATVELFATSWTALRATVADLADDDFARPSGCAGWRVCDLVSHLIVDAQDVLITLASPASAEPTRDSVTYWEIAAGPAVDDPLDALIVRLADAYAEPRLMKHHLDDLGAAAGRAAGLVDPALRVTTRGEVMTAHDYLAAYVLEWTLHHLDLIEHLVDAAPPIEDGLTTARAMFEKIAGAGFPDSWSDADVLLAGTGRRPLTGAQAEEIGELAARLPIRLA